MNDFLERQVHNFSTGMMQKINIARALISNSKVLIFDEACSGLDVIASREFKNIVMSLKSENKIILWSTHIMPDAAELCDDLVFIHKGQKIAEGSKKDIMDKYPSNNLEEIFLKIIGYDN